MHTLPAPKIASPYSKLEVPFGFSMCTLIDLIIRPARELKNFLHQDKGLTFRPTLWRIAIKNWR